MRGRILSVRMFIFKEIKCMQECYDRVKKAETAKNLKNGKRACLHILSEREEGLPVVGTSPRARLSAAEEEVSGTLHRKMEGV